MRAGSRSQLPKTNVRRSALVSWIAGAVVGLSAGAWAAAQAPVKAEDAGTPPRVHTLDECIATALENNGRRPASAFAVAAAEAQHRQALAGYWPQVYLKGGYQRTDETADFLFPAASFNVPPQNITLPFGGTIPVTIPGVGTIPVSSFPIPAQNIEIPAQDVKLADEDSYLASIKATWLLYDGGMRRGLREQASAGIEAAQQEAHRTDLEIVDSVRRFYYGAVLARQLHEVGNDTLARMEATLNLTETMYKEGSGKVTKADYLDNKVMVESLRAMVARLEKNEEAAKSALANTMGLPWRETVTPADQKVPFEPFPLSLDDLVAEAYEFSPDWLRLEAGIRASEGAVKTAMSGHQPKLALTGELHRWWNNYEAGIATDRNKKGWTAGVGIEIPIFEGFLVRNRVKEQQAKLGQLKAQRLLLQEGIGIQLKNLFLELKATGKSYQATLAAMTAAQENQDLNTRAYQNDLVETEKVIRAQLVEALMSAQHYKTVYDQAALLSQMNLVVGTEVMKAFGQQ